MNKKIDLNKNYIANFLKLEIISALFAAYISEDICGEHSFRIHAVAWYFSASLFGGDNICISRGDSSASSAISHSSYLEGSAHIY